jgi:hypothetical protein
MKHRVLGNIAEFPPLEPVGLELHMPGIPEIRPTGSPPPLSLLPLLFALTKKHTRRSESTEHKTGYDPSNDPKGRADEYNSFRWPGSEMTENLPGWGAGWGMQKKAESKQDGRMERVKLSDVENCCNNNIAIE